MGKASTKKHAELTSGLVVHNMPQGSAEWFKVRAGIVTASNFATVMAEGKDGGPSLTRAQYLHRLAAEIITGEPVEESYKSKAMERGNAMEAEAVADYEQRRGIEVRRVGFGINFEDLKRCGASPDGLVGLDGMLETKTMRPDLMIPLIVKGAHMLPEHMGQTQGNMMVFEREWCDLKLFWPKMPDFTVRVPRNEVYIGRMMNEIERFNYDLQTLVKRLRVMGAGQ